MLVSKYRSTGTLPVKDRRKIIGHVAEMMVVRYGQNISIFNKISVAKALIELFPILKCSSDDTEPYVSVWKVFRMLIFDNKQISLAYHL